MADVAGSEPLRLHPFFALFPAGIANALRLAATTLLVKADAEIFRAGDASDSIYLVLDGRVKILATMEAGPSCLLAQMETGSFFGEYGVLDGSARSACAVAATDCELARVPKEQLLAELNHMTGSQALGLMHHVLGSIRASNTRQLQELLQRTRMSVLGESVGSIAHDFRNPLAVISLSADLIGRQSKANPELTEMAGIIGEQVTRMNSMVEDVLDFSRGTIRLERIPLPANLILERFERLNRGFLEGAGVALEVAPAAEDLFLRADLQKMLRVIQNLVNNAAEMLQDGNGRIKLRATASADEVMLCVTDNGPGIPEAIRARLFEPFATAGKVHGIGLGLAIVKAIVTSHEGTIQVETETGQGTTFGLRFARCHADGTPWGHTP